MQHNVRRTHVGLGGDEQLACHAAFCGGTFTVDPRLTFDENERRRKEFLRDHPCDEIRDVEYL